MTQGNGKKKTTTTNLTSETTEHLLSILSSLFTSLPSDSQPRLRLLSKFIEESYSKLDRLSELREELESRLAKLEESSLAEEMEMDEEEKYLERLENGGMALQFCDYVAAWVCMEDDGVRSHLSPLSRMPLRCTDTAVTCRQEIITRCSYLDGQNPSKI